MLTWQQQETPSKVIASYVSIATPLMLLWINHSISNAQLTTSATQQCYEQQQAFFDQNNEVEETSVPSQKDRERDKLSIIWQRMKQTCGLAGISISDEMKQQGANVSTASGTSSTESRLKDGNDTKPVGTPRPKVSDVAKLYIAIADDTQRLSARKLGEMMEQRPIAGMRTQLAAIEVIPHHGDDSLRCLKSKDCEREQPVIASINAALRNRTITVLDIHKNYDESDKLPDHVYELWLASGPLNLKPAHR